MKITVNQNAQSFADYDLYINSEEDNDVENLAYSFEHFRAKSLAIKLGMKGHKKDIAKVMKMFIEENKQSINDIAYAAERVPQDGQEGVVVVHVINVAGYIFGSVEIEDESIRIEEDGYFSDEILNKFEDIAREEIKKHFKTSVFF